MDKNRGSSLVGRYTYPFVCIIRYLTYVLHSCIVATLSVSKADEKYLFPLFRKIIRETRQVYLRSARTMKIFHEQFSLVDLPGVHQFEHPFHDAPVFTQFFNDIHSPVIRKYISIIGRNTIECKEKYTTMIRKSTINRIIFFMLPWFGISPRYKLIILIVRLFWIVTIAFIGLCHYLYFLTHLNSQNLFNLVDCLSSFLAHVKIIAKLIPFWLNQRKFMETLMLITDDWCDCANDIIGLRIMTSKTKISDRITNTILFLHTISIVAYCLGVVLANADVTDQTIELPFINKLVLPFSINTQRMYRFVLFIECTHVLFCNWIGGVTNAIFLAMVLHAGGQIDILQNWLAELTPKEIENNQKTFIIANKIILKHQKIIQFSENIESLYTNGTLVLFISNTLLICSLGFLIVTAIGTADPTEQIMKSLLFYMITNLEAFILCYGGEYLKNKSREVGFATYNCAWYNMKSKDSRILLFIILRSQKQLMLTAGKMMDLTLESFASVMNASGSYLSVLLAMK